MVSGHSRNLPDRVAEADEIRPRRYMVNVPRGHGPVAHEAPGDGQVDPQIP